MEQTISISRQNESKLTDTRTLPFGKIPTDHMFIARYADGQWNDPKIVPFHELTLSPMALCLHYGQTVFEGLKAYVMADGKINIFRIDKHQERFNRSLARMCMPAVPKNLFVEAIHFLVQTDSDWVPRDDDGSLYIRPFMIATENRIGVKISDEYLFMVLCSPTYAYYDHPLKVKIETDFVRASEGGTGEAKCGGNYGASFFPAQKAKEEGFDQILWTDCKNHEFIEESGTMNAMFFVDNVLVTPPLGGSILSGVTRDSILTLARENGMKVEERAISYKELQRAFEEGKTVEAFGAGTAAVVAPIESISIAGTVYNCYLGEDAVMFKIKKQLYDIRKGLLPDNHKWNYIF